MHQPDHGKDPAWVWPYTSRESRLWTSSQCRYLARSWLIISWGELTEREKYQWKGARILVTYRPTLLSTQWGFLNIEMLLQESESGAVLFIHFSPENFISHYLFTLKAEQNFREKLVFLLPSSLPDEHTWVTNITALDDVVCFTVRENRSHKVVVWEAPVMHCQTQSQTVSTREAFTVPWEMSIRWNREVTFFQSNSCLDHNAVKELNCKIKLNYVYRGADRLSSHVKLNLQSQAGWRKHSQIGRGRDFLRR